MGILRRFWGRGVRDRGVWIEGDNGMRDLRFGMEWNGKGGGGFLVVEFLGG